MMDAATYMFLGAAFVVIAALVMDHFIGKD